jgi:hypothetical protein
MSSTIPLPPREQLYNRYCSNKQQKKRLSLCQPHKDGSVFPSVGSSMRQRQCVTIWSGLAAQHTKTAPRTIPDPIDAGPLVPGKQSSWETAALAKLRHFNQIPETRMQPVSQTQPELVFKIQSFPAGKPGFTRRFGIRYPRTFWELPNLLPRGRLRRRTSCTALLYIGVARVTFAKLHPGLLAPC